MYSQTTAQKDTISATPAKSDSIVVDGIKISKEEQKIYKAFLMDEQDGEYKTHQEMVKDFEKTLKEVRLRDQQLASLTAEDKQLDKDKASLTASVETKKQDKASLKASVETKHEKIEKLEQQLKQKRMEIEKRI